MGDLINTAGTCSACGGRVSNIDGRRRTREQLETTHAETCPGIHRVRKTKKRKDNDDEG